MLIHGDCLEKLREIPDNSVDAIVTDPPYGLSFMGKKWDYDVPRVDVWRECLRVLKPGGHALIACGTRTQHRMAVNIEDAGFEIRDVITWLYGSGFPKSLDVSKAIDKAAGAERERLGVVITAPDAAKQWFGWGTALKPACEFWTLARKPLDGTVAKNVEKWGVGGLYIDGCRVSSDSMPKSCTNQNIKSAAFKSDNSERERDTTYNPSNLGRFPANLILDEVAAQMLDKQTGHLHGAKHSRFFYVAKASRSERNAGCEKNEHPCVKPIKLMTYLCRLITPPKGVVLDPFMGSGSTGIAAKIEGFNFIGIEREEQYFKIAEARINSI